MRRTGCRGFAGTRLRFGRYRRADAVGRSDTDTESSRPSGGDQRTTLHRVSHHTSVRSSTSLRRIFMNQAVTVESSKALIKQIVADILEIEPADMTDTSLFKEDHDAD